MTKSNQYPRVLIVLMSKVKADDPCNLLIRMQFGEWPKERLAQIHSNSNPKGNGEFCGHYYQINRYDRYFGKIFQRIRGKLINMSEMNKIESININLSKNIKYNFVVKFKKIFADIVINSGLWELIFTVRISKDMMRFINEFRPNLIYCQGYSLGFTRLPIIINKKYKIPICFQTTDDWPTYTYNSFIMRMLIRKTAKKLIYHSTIRMAFGEKMQQLYQRRYGMDFLLTYHLDEHSRFQKNENNRSEQLWINDEISIIYTGSLGHHRFEGIHDLIKVIKSLNKENLINIKINIYCTGIPKNIPIEIISSLEVKFHNLPSHNDLPCVLNSASILFLTESFSVRPEEIEYAISSKAHLYMMSSKPIIVYGPAYSGSVDYAIKGGWAQVVTKRDENLLKIALLSILYDHKRNAEMKKKAFMIINSNHDLTVGRKIFKTMINQALSKNNK